MSPVRGFANGVGEKEKILFHHLIVYECILSFSISPDARQVLYETIFKYSEKL